MSVQLQPYCKHTMYPILHRSATKPIQSKRNEKENHDKQKTESLKPTRDSLELYFLFMGLQPLKPCLVGLTVNGRPKHSARSPVPMSCDAYDEWMVQTLSTFHCPPVLQHLRHRPNIYTAVIADHFPMLTLFTALIPGFTLFPVGQSPTRPGGGGATPTLKIHDVSNSTPVRNQTNPNRTKKKTVSSENQRFKANAGFFGFVFLFMGLQPLKPCLATLTANGISRHSERPPVSHPTALTTNE